MSNRVVEAKNGTSPFGVGKPSSFSRTHLPRTTRMHVRRCPTPAPEGPPAAPAPGADPDPHPPHHLPSPPVDRPAPPGAPLAVHRAPSVVLGPPRPSSRRACERGGGADPRTGATERGHRSAPTSHLSQKLNPIQRRWMCASKIMNHLSPESRDIPKLCFFLRGCVTERVSFPPRFFAFSQPPQLGSRILGVKTTHLPLRLF